MRKEMGGSAYKKKDSKKDKTERQKRKKTQKA